MPDYTERSKIIQRLRHEIRDAIQYAATCAKENAMLHQRIRELEASYTAMRTLLEQRIVDLQVQLGQIAAEKDILCALLASVVEAWREMSDEQKRGVSILVYAAMTALTDAMNDLS
jgi:hypothetical protein